MLLMAAGAVIAPFEIEVPIVVGIAALDHIFPSIEEKHAIDHIVITVARD